MIHPPLEGLLRLISFSCFGVSLAAAAAPRVSRAQEPERAPIRITWLGHAGFEVVSAGRTRVLIDPWLLGNPAVPAPFGDTLRYAVAATRPAAILATHAHGDHDGDVALLARVSGAQVIATGDHLAVLGIATAQQRSINLGGVQQVGDVSVHAVPAMHSVAPGRALGFVLRFADGRTLCHTGDTWIFGDMALIERFHHPKIVLLAAGGGRAGQDPATAAQAARIYFPAAVVIPMHWGALPPPFATEAEVRRAFADAPRVRVLQPGVELVF